MHYTLLLIVAQVGNRESNNPDAQRTDLWLLILITVILIAGFIAVIRFTRKSKAPTEQRKKGPHLKDSWWNP